MRLAFYAPLKPPDHPVPSGDRAVARALVAALQDAGHAVLRVSSLRTFLAEPDPDAMRDIEDAAGREVARLTERFETEGPPELWFTYHSYYRAPDLVGPVVAARFGTPYILLEASRAAKRATGPWSRWHDLNDTAIRAAAVHLWFTPRDREGLAALVGPDRLLELPPFLAGEALSDAPRRPREVGAPLRLLTVAMMRPGKLGSYGRLAAALALLPRDLDWTLQIAGDGPSRAEVEAAFAGLPPNRVAFAGLVGPEARAALMAEADLFVWPGLKEPFGVAYLEAQAAGLPVLAMASGGVASVVDHGRTGLLTPEGDLVAYRDALLRLAADPDLRLRLGREGARMVRQERSPARAAAILQEAFQRAVEIGSCPTP